MVNSAKLIAIITFGFSVSGFAEQSEFQSTETDVPNSQLKIINLEEETIATKEGRTYPLRNALRQEIEMHKRREAFSDIQKYATSAAIGGALSNEVEKFKGEDISGLYDILQDPLFGTWWIDTISLVGMLGDESAIDKLIEYSLDESKTDSSALGAKGAAYYAVGVLGGRMNSKKAIDHVINGLDLSRWEQRSDFSKGNSVYLSTVLRNVVSGLAYSGDERALAALQELSNKTSKDSKLAHKWAERSIRQDFLTRQIQKAIEVRELGFYAARDNTLKAYKQHRLESSLKHGIQY